MSQRIIGLVIAASLAGCNAPTTNTPRTATVPPVSIQPGPTSDPDFTSVEPPQDTKEGNRHVDNPVVVARLRRLIDIRTSLSAKMFEAGVAIEGNPFVGTLYNEIHAREHKCWVLGQLLGKADIVQSLEISYKPDYSTRTIENGSNLKIMSVSLDNFVIAAENVLQMSHDERIATWNLDCSGQLGLPKAFIKQEGQSSFYKISNDGKMLIVLGTIESGFARKIRDAVEANPSVEIVALGSGGGYVDEAMKAGLYIRNKGLNTTLFNNCYSACPLVFMAGVERLSFSPYPELGFHQIYTSDGQAIPFDSIIYGQVYNYLVRMGIEPGYVIRQMWSASPSGMTYVDGYDSALCDANITTWIQRGCVGYSNNSWE